MIEVLLTKLSDDPYTMDQMTGPSMNTHVVRPLVDELYSSDDISIGIPPPQVLSLRIQGCLN
jgi:hypothetical protein